MNPFARSALLIGLMTAWHVAHAQAPGTKYPIKPIRMIIGYAPGGGSDIMGRLMAQQITEALGQQVVVENRAGAAQNIAAEYVARQPADGYTVFMSSAAHSINVSLYSKINYDPVKDFAPVAIFATSPNLLLVHPSFPAKTVKEFIAVAKKNPGRLNYSSSGVGSSQHLSGEMLNVMIGSGMTHVPYKGSAPSLAGLASGEVDFAFNNIPSAQPLMSAGRVRALGITSAKRSPLLPNLPTMVEGGLPGFVTETWYGILVPAATPREVINTLNTVAVKSVQKPEFRERLAQMGADPLAESPEFFASYLASEIARWAKVVRDSKARAD
ncbi:MAG: tripartite tricarboxylate transporter substrate binding protein [Proteobacteria bacterium]|nr:tripartite tricarboxylate transporter substrate binding protein [Burkholderiales bacterium]